MKIREYACKHLYSNKTQNETETINNEIVQYVNDTKKKNIKNTIVGLCLVIDCHKLLTTNVVCFCSPFICFCRINRQTDIVTVVVEVFFYIFIYYLLVFAVVPLLHKLT